MPMPDHINKRLGRRLVSTVDRTGMFEGYRVLKREHENMKRVVANLLIRIQRLEGTNSPDAGSDSPDVSP